MGLAMLVRDNTTLPLSSLRRDICLLGSCCTSLLRHTLKPLNAPPDASFQSLRHLLQRQSLVDPSDRPPDGCAQSLNTPLDARCDGIDATLPSGSPPCRLRCQPLLGAREEE